MARSIRGFFAGNYMDILLVTWYILHLPLLVLFIILNVGYYYFAALVLFSAVIYHLVKRSGNRRSLATYFVITIIGYLCIIGLILNLQQPAPVINTESKTKWLVASNHNLSDRLIY